MLYPSLSFRNSAWTPEIISPALWLDANDSSTLTLVSGAVSEWRDKSGNNRHATQATASDRPLLVTGGLNGTDVIRFDGLDDFLSCGDVLDLLNNSFESFVVVKPNQNTNNVFYAKSVAAGAVSRYALGFDENSNLSSLIHPNTGAIAYPAIYPSSSFSSTSPNICSQKLTYSNLNEIRLNGVTVASASVSSWTSMDSTFRFLIGAYNNSTDSGEISNLNGDISQIIMFTRALTQAEREQMEGYLAWSTGLQENLPVDHPYKNQAP